MYCKFKYYTDMTAYSIDFRMSLKKIALFLHYNALRQRIDSSKRGRIHGQQGGQSLSDVSVPGSRRYLIHLTYY